MNNVIKLVLQGLATVLPLGLTAYFIYWILASTEAYSKQLLLLVTPASTYFPGLGILTALILLFVIGLLVNAYGVRYLVQLSDKLVARIPLVKSLYGALQDMMRVFTLAEKKGLGNVVSLDIGNDMHLIGFLTGEESGKKLFPGDSGSNKVGVYLPMSYQIGGFTVYVDKAKLNSLNVSVEEAMRITITGGAQSSKDTKN